MDGVDKFDAAKVLFHRTAVVHGLNFRRALGIEPESDFVARDDRSAGALGNGHHVIHMVFVPVRNEDVIRRHRVDVNR